MPPGGFSLNRTPYTNAIHYTRGVQHLRIAAHPTSPRPTPSLLELQQVLPPELKWPASSSFSSWLCVPTPPHIPSTPGGRPTSGVPPVSKVLSVALPRSTSSRILLAVPASLPFLLTAAGLLPRSSPSPAPPPRLLYRNGHACTRRQTTASRRRPW